MVTKDDKQRLSDELRRMSDSGHVFVLPLSSTEIIAPHEDETDEEFRRRAAEACGVTVLELGANGSPVIARTIGQVKEAERED